MNTPTPDSAVDLRSFLDLDERARLDLVGSGPEAAERLRARVREMGNLVLADLSLAMRAATPLIALADALNDADLRVETRTTASNAMSYANRFDQAIALLEEARAIAGTQENRHTLGRVELAFVQPYARLGRFTDAVRCATAAVGHFDAVGDDMMAAKAHSNLGVIHRMRGDAASAIPHFDRALLTLRTDVVAQAQLESNRAEALLDLARFREAETAFRRALVAFSQTPHRRGSAIVEGNLADLLGRQGRLQASIRHFERAQRMLEDDEAAGDAARLGAERAEVLLSVGLTEEAITTFVQALRTLDQQGFANEAARARIGLGLAQARRGRLDVAEMTLQRAAAEFAAIDARHGLIDAHLALARVLLERGALDEAASLLEDIGAEVRAESRRVEIAALRARVRLAQGDDADAIRLIDEVREDPAAAALPLVHADLLQLRGRALLELRRDDDARRDLEAAVHEVERIRGSLLGDRMRTAWLGDRLAPYHDLLTLALRRQDARRVFEVIEMVRSRALLDVMQGGIELVEQVVQASGDDAEEAALVSDLTAQRAELNLVFDRMHSGGHERREVADRVDLERRARVLERSIATIEGRLAATRRFGELFSRPMDAEAMARILEPGAVLVEYFMAGPRLGALVVRDGSFAAHDLGLSHDASRELAARIAFQVDRGLAGASRATDRRDRLVGHAERELAGLHDALIRPLEEYLQDAHHVVFSPHGPLFGVPLHAAYDGERFLVQKHVISYTPSASLLATLKRRARPGGDRAVIVGVADHAAPAIMGEARALHAALPDATLLLGQEATLEEVRRVARDAALLHIATHGIFPAHDPFAARLRLADQWMSVRDIYALHLEGCAVTLSACEAGRSAVLAGDELFGLVRAFLAAGASSVITSLWSVHDESARELMEVMYDASAQRSPAGMKPAAPPRAATLCAAQSHLLAHRRHPAFWAPFFCIGGAS